MRGKGFVEKKNGRCYEQRIASLLYIPCELFWVVIESIFHSFFFFGSEFVFSLLSM